MPFLRPTASGFPLPNHTPPSLSPIPPSPSSPTASFLCRPPFRQIGLLLLLLAYQLAGAALFLLCEAGNDRRRRLEWTEQLGKRRAQLVIQLGDTVRRALFNQSANDAGGQKLLLDGNPHWEKALEHLLARLLLVHEGALLSSQPPAKMQWDLWNAMLFALSIFTTIGYGQLSPSTPTGRLLTMLYAIGGIPLLLFILDDLGRLLTRFLQFLWFAVKCTCRRITKSCTRQSQAEIRILDHEDRQELFSAELPLPLALIALFVWLCLCARLICVWENDWTFPAAFYFIFTSLTTIGLGDVMPAKAHYLPVLSALLIIGLAFVSLTISLVQSKCFRASSSFCCCCCFEISSPPSHPSGTGIADAIHQSRSLRRNPLLRRYGHHNNQPCAASLGVLSTNTSSSFGSAIRQRLRQRQWHNKCTQTLLSFPSPAIRNSRVTKAVVQNGLKLLPRTLSIDDVMRLVDTEEGDILLLTELTLSRDNTGGSGGLSSSTTADELMSSQSSNSMADFHHQQQQVVLGTSSSSSSSSEGNENSGGWTSGSNTANEGEQQQQKQRRSKEPDYYVGSGQQQMGAAVDELLVPSSRFFDRCCNLPPVLLPAPLPMLMMDNSIPITFPLFSSLIGHPPTPVNFSDLEMVEEMEDRMVFTYGGLAIDNSNSARTAARGIKTAAATVAEPLFGGRRAVDNRLVGVSNNTNPGVGVVHFRSRLSLIPERTFDEEQQQREEDGLEKDPASSPGADEVQKGVSQQTHVVVGTASEAGKSAHPSENNVPGRKQGVRHQHEPQKATAGRSGGNIFASLFGRGRIPWNWRSRNTPKEEEQKSGNSNII